MATNYKFHTCKGSVLPAFVQSGAGTHPGNHLEQFVVSSCFLVGVCQPSGNLLRQTDLGQKLKFRTLKENLTFGNWGGGGGEESQDQGREATLGNRQMRGLLRTHLESL